MSTQRLKKFVDDLARTTAPQHAKNPWAHPLRRRNLQSYFEKMYALRPTVLLVGEAPGYRGCGRVGVPFSSEKLFLAHPFFADKKRFDILEKESPVAEASASIVWKTFDALDFYPLMWATYPFHPHKPGNVLSNRAPRPEEVALGRDFLKRLIDLFAIEEVIAVGRVAEKNLVELNIPATAVRHPSHGGATEFAKGLKKFVSTRTRSKK
jgi:hypothetical protein